MYKQLLALSTLCGTIIGVGLFGLPYVTAQIGFLPIIFYFAVLGVVIITVHLMYGEISCRTKGSHRLPGFCRIYLGKKTEKLSYFTTIIGLTGALLAYVIVGGEFLAHLLQPFFGGATELYAVLFFAVGALLIYGGSGPVSKTEFFSLGIFFAIITILFFKILPQINYHYFTTINLALKTIFIPYGIILFAVDGTAVIPEVKEILKNQQNSFKKIIILGTALPIITYLIFIFIVLGITGQNTTTDGLSGLSQVLGNGIIYLGFTFGIITTFTSFLTLGITLKKEFNYDLGLPALLSWILACLPTIILYLLGINNFISVISFIGSVALGIDIIVITLIYLKAKKTGQQKPIYSLRVPKLFIGLMTTMFILGVIIEVTKILI